MVQVTVTATIDATGEEIGAQTIDIAEGETRQITVDLQNPRAIAQLSDTSGN